MMDALSPEQISKLKQVITEGVKIKQEIKDLNDGLKDVVKHVADEISVNPADINRTIKLAQKKLENSEVVQEEQEKLDTAGALLDMSGF